MRPATGEVRTKAWLEALVIDVGGTDVKTGRRGQRDARKVPPGPRLTANGMVAGVKAITRDWKYDAVSLGYPGVVRNGRIAAEPVNLGRGRVGLGFRQAFRRPVRLDKDAVMQASGSCRGGTMLFSDLGMGPGTALVVSGHVVPGKPATSPAANRPSRITPAAGVSTVSAGTRGGSSSRRSRANSPRPFASTMPCLREGT
jgi:predicted NBD/HSP70 family sugar kinase